MEGVSAPAHTRVSRQAPIAGVCDTFTTGAHAISRPRYQVHPYGMMSGWVAEVLMVQANAGRCTVGAGLFRLGAAGKSQAAARQLAGRNHAAAEWASPQVAPVPNLQRTTLHRDE